jgi:ribonuclease G
MQKHGHLAIAVHPILYAYLTKGLVFSSIFRKWKRKYAIKLEIRENNTYHLTEFHFYDGNGEEIKL